MMGRPRRKKVLHRIPHPRLTPEERAKLPKTVVRLYYQLTPGWAEREKEIFKAAYAAGYRSRRGQSDGSGAWIEGPHKGTRDHEWICGSECAARDFADALSKTEVIKALPKVKVFVDAP